MAALCAGNYGLSQQGSLNDENKELIFVKLTDSALRAIEEFQRTQAKLGTSHNPSIQFLQNGQGFLSFPSGGNNVQKFNFSITDIDTGSIECIQQAQGQLQNMGHIPHKMRIHANDDVYETTRHRLAAAEENQKNKCCIYKTKVYIKQNWECVRPRIAGERLSRFVSFLVHNFRLD